MSFRQKKKSLKVLKRKWDDEDPPKGSNYLFWWRKGSSSSGYYFKADLIDIDGDNIESGILVDTLQSIINEVQDYYGFTRA